MIRTAIPVLLALGPLSLVSGLFAQDSIPVAPPGQLKTLQELLTEMQAAEKSATSVYLEMTSKGSYAGDVNFDTQGTLRVLHGTHFQMHLLANFGEGMSAESETVKTPEGVWIREDDPAFGKVFLKMDKELVDKLDEATRILGQEGAAVPGAMSEQSTSPLGSSMLESLSQQYDLKVERKVYKDGQECWVVAGDLRGDLPPPDENAPPVPDRVDILVRTLDSAVLQMVHLKDGREQLRVNITRLELNRPMAEDSFRIDGEGQVPMDIMEHPPAAAQIQSTLDAAQAKKGGD